MAFRLFFLSLLVMFFALSQAPSTPAHAILVSSAPVAKSAVPGPDVAIQLKFNVRVDGERSRLTLLEPGTDAKPLSLKIEKQAAADVLSAKASGLKPGAYSVRWQVLASDGHITRGEVPFTVRAT